MMFSLYTLTQF